MTAPLTTPALPKLIAVSCPAGCEQGHVIQYAGTEFESYPRCETCGGSGFIELCATCDEPTRIVSGLETCGCEVNCETCDSRVPLSDIVDAGVCRSCFAEGLETIRREEDERSAWVAEQLGFGRAVGWL